VWESIPIPAQFDIGQPPAAPLPHQRLMAEAVEAVEKGERFQFFAPSEPPKKAPIAREAPRSNAPSPSRHTPDNSLYQAPPPATSPRAVPSPDKPDTAPSPETPVTQMTDTELKPYFNEVMRRRMKLRRAKQKDEP
jgi:hypothetical protein